MCSEPPQSNTYHVNFGILMQEWVIPYTDSGDLICKVDVVAGYLSPPTLIGLVYRLLCILVKLNSTHPILT